MTRNAHDKAPSLQAGMNDTYDEFTKGPWEALFGRASFCIKSINAEIFDTVCGEFVRSLEAVVADIDALAAWKVGLPTKISAAVNRLSCEDEIKHARGNAVRFAAERVFMNRAIFDATEVVGTRDKIKKLYFYVEYNTITFAPRHFRKMLNCACIANAAELASLTHPIYVGTRVIKHVSHMHQTHEECIE